MTESGGSNSAKSAPLPSPRIALLSAPSAWIFLGIVGIAAWMDKPLVVFLAGLVLAIIAVARGWSRWSVARLAYGRHLSATRAFPGDRVTVSVTLDNRKLLPLTWIETDDPLPAAIAPLDDIDDDDGAGNGLGLSTALLWYQKATLSRTLLCRRRGWFPIGPARLETGDIFGLLPRTAPPVPADALTVCPTIHPLAAFDLPARHPLGEVRTGSRLFEDPSRLAGLRDYTPDTPMRRIHWKASARHQSLQVKLFDPSVTVETMLYLAVDDFGADADFELAASAAASLAHHLIENRQATGLAVNAAEADGSGLPHLAPGRGEDQLVAILEALAKVGPVAAVPFPRFLDESVVRLRAGATVAVIAAAVTPSLLERLETLRRRRFQSQILLTGGPEIDTGAIPCRLLRAPDDLRGAA